MELPRSNERSSDHVVASKHVSVETPSSRAEFVLGAQAEACPTHAADFAIQGDDPGRSRAVTSASIVALPAPASQEVRGRLVRERINAAARPILERFARRGGVPLERLRKVIEGPTPLTHPEIVRRLGGALHSEAMQSVIASNADPALAPMAVRAGVVKMMAQDLGEPPPAAARETFPDWDKPLAPCGHQVQPWHPRDAAVWLKRFPPSEALLQPMDIWDGATAALWLNDRESVRPCEDELGGTVVAFEPQGVWIPSLEVLHTLYELELEALSYRVFVERLRREVMPYYVSERRIRVRNAVELVTFGYQTLEEARRSVRAHDLRRTGHFYRVFGDNEEWISDLCRQIIAAYAWPAGFSEPELWSEFPDLWPRR